MSLVYEQRQGTSEASSGDSERRYLVGDVINSAKSALSATGSTTPVATGANQLAVAVGIVHTF
ncbi:hypothetical protein [Paraburkholderia sp. SIMBA_030]|uniref:hypothetical protein n=1 Tax=Paraburkholderia sp. SIMBA_030 TaxID=3085773 RepID=UPI00397D73DD